jgi:hypothetical protein
MTDLSINSKLDKSSLIGSCLQLPVIFEIEKLVSEFHSIPIAMWGSRGGRVGVHVNTEAVFLRGYAPAEGNLPIEDRPILDSLPYVRWLIYGLFNAMPQRCLFARLRADSEIRPHIDQGEYFENTVRIHFPVVTNSDAVMMADGFSFHMRAGEVWALNNNTIHGVFNRHPSEARTHLICDYLPSNELRQILLSGRHRLASLDGIRGGGRCFEADHAL